MRFITVLMPAYNAAKYIGEAIASVLQQSLTDFELLIIDDGSTDDTIAVIKTFDDPRIRLVKQQHQGISQTLNNGLKQAKGCYIARFDADDICYPNRLQLQYDFLVNNPDYILVGSDAEYIGMNGDYVFTSRYTAYTDEEIRRLKPAICPFSHVCVMYKKEDVLLAGGYDNHAITFEDHLLWLKIISRGKVCNLRQPLVKVRFNPESVTIDEKWRGKEFMRIKYRCIANGYATAEDETALKRIIDRQNSSRVKGGAYNALIAKKYLWDNYRPRLARLHLRKLINHYPTRPGAWILYLISFLPRPAILFLYRTKPKMSFYEKVD